MAEQTGIEWAHATWNPWYGCKKVSPGCAKCYMFRDMKHYGRDPNVVTRAADASFRNPLKWARAKKLNEGSRIFTCSWSDWFIDKADDWRDEAWSIIHDTPQFNYLILTKRPERIADHLPVDWGYGYANVWLGVSAENQEMADKRVRILADTPAKVRFVSAEPLLSEIDFDFTCLDCDGLITIHKEQGNHPTYIGERIHWVITGGESDTNPRPTNLDWVRSIRDQCKSEDISFFHKQHGGNKKINGHWGGRELDGRMWDEFPK